MPSFHIFIVPTLKVCRYYHSVNDFNKNYCDGWKLWEVKNESSELELSFIFLTFLHYYGRATTDKQIVCLYKLVRIPNKI